MSNEINLSTEMNDRIVGLLRLHGDDDVEMYAAKLIESLQEEVRDLKARLDYIQNFKGEIH